MRTKIEAVLTPIWLLALSILVTIYLAWGFYYFDIDEAIIYDIEQSYIDSKVKSENYTSPTTEWDIINKMFE